MPLRVSRFLKDMWLTAAIVKDKDIEDTPLTITKVYSKRVGSDEKLVIALDGVDRHLPLNQTNLRTMLESMGGVDDASEWVGAKIKLFVTTATFQGEDVDAIRLEVVSTKPQRAANVK